MHLEELIEQVKAEGSTLSHLLTERLILMQQRHKMAIRGGKRVCGHCTRGHDMRSLVLWPCAEYKILSGMTNDEADPSNPSIEVFRPGKD